MFRGRQRGSSRDDPVMSRSSLNRDAAIIREHARRIDKNTDLDALVAMAGEAQVVLLGEASHGTHEFYAMRAELTQRLIAEHGFRGVVIEADWPDTFRVHRYVTGRGDDPNCKAALGGFRRFPAWMWRNSVVVDFVEWLRNWNATAVRAPAGFYGMDLYSLHRSIEAVLSYLKTVDPAAAVTARQRYACFGDFAHNPESYGMATARKGKEPCDDEAIAQLVELRRKEVELTWQDGLLAEEDLFSAEQNARLVVNAERYYRSMFHGQDESWNLRDTHMFETLGELLGHLGKGSAKLVVWAHNSHLGDSRATQMHERGELNVGRLVRERFGSQALLVGFSTYFGTVTAAEDWGEPAKRRRVRPALEGSCEELFHATGDARFWLNLRERNSATELLRERRLQRAIGVVYRPQTERWSHYFHTRLPEQFDALIHIDETRALVPLEGTAALERGERP